MRAKANRQLAFRSRIEQQKVWKRLRSRLDCKASFRLAPAMSSSALRMCCCCDVMVNSGATTAWCYGKSSAGGNKRETAWWTRKCERGSIERWRSGKEEERRGKLLVGRVLLQPHIASLAHATTAPRDSSHLHAYTLSAAHPIAAVSIYPLALPSCLLCPWLSLNLHCFESARWLPPLGPPLPMLAGSRRSNGRISTRIYLP